MWLRWVAVVLCRGVVSGLVARPPMARVERAGRLSFSSSLRTTVGEGPRIRGVAGGKSGPRLSRRRDVSVWLGPENVEALFDPAQFTPVCTASDVVYRQTQGLVQFIAGPDVYQEYAPLIAGALLRVRLELCVIESFVFEAIVPFVQENGLSWVLPAQETVQTFVAGTIFAVALNVIFVGSTKILSLIVTFFDVFLGMPARFLASLPLAGSAAGKNKQNDDDASTASPAALVLLVVGAFGKLLEVLRNIAEFADVFVGRYLAILTVIYVTIKFLHFRIITIALPF